MYPVYPYWVYYYYPRPILPPAPVVYYTPWPVYYW